MATRVLLTRKEAAEALGMSLSHFQRHVQPFIPCVYSGQLRLYRPTDLEKWAEEKALSSRKDSRNTREPRRKSTKPYAGIRS